MDSHSVRQKSARQTELVEVSSIIPNSIMGGCWWTGGGNGRMAWM